jgi:isopenicillin-N N-acyltransferase-like protein
VIGALPHHVARERAPGDRGAEFGRAHAEAVRTTVRTYRRLLDEAAGVPPARLAALGDAVAAVVARRWPDLVEEIEGIAGEAGVDARELVAVNARTELLGPVQAAECSVVGSVGGGGALRLAQNWDWHPDLAASRVIVSGRRGDGPWFHTVTEAGILAKLGLNSTGIAVGLNFLTCSLDGGTDGLPIHLLLRLLLDRCERAVDALALLLGTQVSASSCIAVAAAEAGGDALFAVEVSPGGAAVVWPDAGGALRHTNHFLAGPPQGTDTQPALYPSTLLRLVGLEREAPLASHFPAGESICRHPDPAAPWAERRATLLSIELEPRAQRMRIAPGPPCETPYEPVELPQ